jgi:sterol desaturase/sphingolipid hydroxylase (fatty acid hydroxylase superfamily)
MLIDRLRSAAVSFLSPAPVMSLPQLLVAFAIAFAYLAYRQARRRGTFRLAVILRAISRRRLLFNRSTCADFFYFLLNTCVVGTLIGWGIFSGLMVSDLSVRLLRAAFGVAAPSTSPEWALRTGLTFVAFLGYEIGYYLDHYLKHKIPFLWKFHKVHHSAEVLTPLTVFRVHPIDSLIFTDIVAAVSGLLHGIFIYAAGKSVGIYTIDQANVIVVAFLFLLAHLQHSQVWIPLGGLPGRLFLSPAHHQIHHSIDPAHYDRNLGSFLAIWDWMFGTLVIPSKESPRLKFGTAQTSEDPHCLMALLIDPMVNALAIAGIKQRAAARDPSIPSAVAIEEMREA